MADRTCNRCRTIRDESEFYFNKSRQQYNHWCKPCYKKWHRNRYQTKSAEAHDGARPCVQCGTVFTPKQRRVVLYCSRLCKDVAKNARNASRRLASKPKRACMHCGADIPPEKFITAVFCNKKCSSAAHQATRKMRRRAADPELDLISRAAIAERDGWRCGICGKKVQPHLEHPDPRCASIDHVVPLARGGDNSPANLQLAHLRCNLSKRADGVIQPRLV